MTHASTRRRTAAALAAAALAASATLAGTVAPALATEGVPGWDSHIDVAPDYLVDTYGLPADHVVETVTVERFEWLLNGKYEDNSTPVTGRFAFLIGGPEDENTRATIGYVDQVAKQYGVDKIYLFDPALDGRTLDIWDTSALNLNAAGKAALETLGNRLIDSYLNKDTTPQFTKASTDPYLFIYDKGRTVDVGGVPTEDRIVASLNVRTTTTALAAPGAADAYKAQVAAVFDAIAVDGVAHVDHLDQWSFWKAEANRRHKVSYPNAAVNGDKILTEADGAQGWRIQTITYEELRHLVQQDGDYLILFGGTWCHNTRAVIKQINTLAQEHGITTVYNFDNSLDSTGNGSSNYLHIRDNAAVSAGAPSRASYLYGDLWNTYFPNVVTEYGSVVQYYPGGDTTKPVQTAQKGQVPFLIEYDKDHVSAGTPAPVVRQWIQNTAGTYKEYMIEWWQTPTAGALSGNSKQLAFAAEAEAALGTFFAALPGEAVPVVPATPAAPVASVTDDAVTVSWSAPADGGSAITGYRVSLDGGTPVSVGAGVTSHTFTSVALGAHTVKVVAVNAVGDSPASPASNTVTAVSPAEVKGTLSVSGDLRPGGTITVRGSGFAESTSGFAVEIHSTPQSLGTVGTDTGGAFTFTATIPSDVPAGDHSIVVLYGGAVVSAAAITVAADPALAATGADPGIIALTVGGVAVLLLGGLVVAGGAARRRRPAA
ncbi:MAG: hypothetical protein QM598_03180 [Protaetiibacter sp.]